MIAIAVVWPSKMKKRQKILAVSNKGVAIALFSRPIVGLYGDQVKFKRKK